MAEQVNFVGHLTPVSDVLVAGESLLAHQYKYVQLHPAGVFLAHPGSIANAAQYVLGLPANSGEAVSLNIAPNVARCIAGGAITLGTWVQPGSGGLVFASSVTDTAPVGVAHTSAAGSGTYVSVHLRR